MEAPAWPPTLTFHQSVYREYLLRAPLARVRIFSRQSLLLLSPSQWRFGTVLTRRGSEGGVCDGVVVVGRRHVRWPQLEGK